MTGRLSEAHQGTGDHWRVLLIELVHLLGLYLNHARRAKGLRAAGVLFDQLVRRLSILDQMPGHDGGLILRRLELPSIGNRNFPNYLLLFGDMALRGSEALALEAKSQRRISHLAHALDKAFGYFEEQGIHALYLQLPGRSNEKIDQLRLALNIVALFRLAVENNASVTFRYLGRAQTVPLVRDSQGRPDPNLTLVAGLNGFSAANARELIKQARAYCNLSVVQTSNDRAISDYNRIFSVRGLRTQLIRPPVEINNLPWMHTQDRHDDVVPQHAGHASAKSDALQVGIATSQDVGQAVITTGAVADIASIRSGHPDPLQRHLVQHIEMYDKGVRTAFEQVYALDYATLDAQQLADRILAASRIFEALDEAMDAVVIQGVLSVFHDRLRRVPESVIEQIGVQRQGLKIVSHGRAMILGLMPPRLLDLIALVKEAVLTRKKIGLFKNRVFDFDQCSLADFEALFGNSTVDFVHLRNLLRDCLDKSGNFSRQHFTAQINELKPYGHIVFEILWCHLRQIPQRQERLVFLNALPLLLIHLKDPDRALRFLLSDLCLDPMQIAFTDRNAFVLATLLLRKHNKELNLDIDCTPLEVLNVKRSLNPAACQYAAWRLDMDQDRMVSKINTIRDGICHATTIPSENEHQLPFELRFLLALEREALIFMALTGGETARKVFCSALNSYGEPQAEIYMAQHSRRHLAGLMAQLKIVVQGLGRVGHRSDIEGLKALEKASHRLNTLDNEPAHTLRVKQVMDLIPASIKALQVSSA